MRPLVTSDPTVHAGRLARYSCRSVAEIDAHLTRLTVRLRALVDQPRLWRACREDIDALIDRRLQLMEQGAA